MSAVNPSIRDARAEILRSIRDHLERSLPADAIYAEAKTHVERPSTITHYEGRESSPGNLIDQFCEQLESVGGHCLVVQNQSELSLAVERILAEQRNSSNNPRIAFSDASLLQELGIKDATTTPSSADLFDYDVGISTVQAGIAETGTLVLESDRERNRLVSLVPPMHIAILDASKIQQTMAEVLEVASRNGLMSRAITFITGPSRTADIELTLAIGVHGPKELYVIIYQDTD